MSSKPMEFKTENIKHMLRFWVPYWHYDCTKSITVRMMVRTKSYMIVAEKNTG